MSEVDVKEEDCKKTKLNGILDGIGVFLLVILLIICGCFYYYIVYYVVPELIAQKFNLSFFYALLLWIIFLHICKIIIAFACRDNKTIEKNADNKNIDCNKKDEEVAEIISDKSDEKKVKQDLIEKKD